MTTEERFERIEHVTAAQVEERRKDREEYKTLWRDTQRQLDEAARATAQLALGVERFATETRIRIEELATETRAGNRSLRAAIEETDAKLGERIAALISAIGELLSRRP